MLISNDVSSVNPRAVASILRGSSIDRMTVWKENGRETEENPLNEPYEYQLLFRIYSNSTHPLSILEKSRTSFNTCDINSNEPFAEESKKASSGFSSIFAVPSRLLIANNAVLSGTLTS